MVCEADQRLGEEPEADDQLMAPAPHDLFKFEQSISEEALFTQAFFPRNFFPPPTPLVRNLGLV